jgi:hypothetical protein
MKIHKDFQPLPKLTPEEAQEQMEIGLKSSVGYKAAKSQTREQELDESLQDEVDTGLHYLKQRGPAPSQKQNSHSFLAFRDFLASLFRKVRL